MVNSSFGHKTRLAGLITYSAWPLCKLRQRRFGPIPCLITTGAFFRRWKIHQNISNQAVYISLQQLQNLVTSSLIDLPCRKYARHPARSRAAHDAVQRAAWFIYDDMSKLRHADRQVAVANGFFLKICTWHGQFIA